MGRDYYSCYENLDRQIFNNGKGHDHGKKQARIDEGGGTPTSHFQYFYPIASEFFTRYIYILH